ncbi:MAG UNVERIFIED_CONTAM: SH3 domain-containing protein [Microcystis novacekii LVE1205-3]
MTWQSGLSLRSQPTSESTRLGGLDYNTKVSVVGTSRRWPMAARASVRWSQRLD